MDMLLDVLFFADSFIEKPPIKGREHFQNTSFNVHRKYKIWHSFHIDRPD